MLRIHVASKSYPAANGGPEVEILRDFEFRAESGEFVCLFGPSGCGKTTLLNIVAGLDPDYRGRIDLPDPKDGGQMRIGYVFQEPRLLPWRTVRDNVRLAVLDDVPRLAEIDGLLQSVGLAGLENAYPRQLSAGQARRATLARAFATDPDLLLLDEPFVSLDDPAAERLRATLLQSWLAQPATILFVTHDLEEALLMADRILLLAADPLSVVADRTIEVPREGRVGSPDIERLKAEFEELRRGRIPGCPGGGQ